MSVIAISGTQGSGKTTLLNAIEEKGYNIDKFKVSRYVQQRYGTLHDAIETDLQKFQNKIFNFKYLNDYVLALESELYFVERSFIDFAVYTTLWVEKNKRHDLEEWKNDYVERCIETQCLMYDGFINLKYNHELDFESEPNRGTFEDINRYEQIFNEIQNRCNIRKIEILELDSEKRVESVINFAKGIV